MNQDLFIFLSIHNYIDFDQIPYTVGLNTSPDHDKSSSDIPVSLYTKNVRFGFIPQ